MRWLVLVAFVLAACGADAPGPPSPAATATSLPTRPPVPPGWRVVAAGGGGLRLALPPDIVASDTSGPIFANQPPPSSGGDWIQLLAEGQGSDEQPAAGEPLEQWLERRWLAQEPARGPTTQRQLLLPAGPAVELRTTLQPGTAHERLVILYAIRGPSGVGFLVIDGPPAEMAAHESDLALIPMLLELSG